jgi:hypothetical protein
MDRGANARRIGGGAQSQHVLGAMRLHLREGQLRPAEERYKDETH